MSSVYCVWNPYNALPSNTTLTEGNGPRPAQSMLVYDQPASGLHPYSTVDSYKSAVITVIILAMTGDAGLSTLEHSLRFPLIASFIPSFTLPSSGLRGYDWQTPGIYDKCRKGDGSDRKKAKSSGCPQYIQCESKKSPAEDLWQFFQNGWEFFNQILRAYYAFLSTLDYKFLFS